MKDLWLNYIVFERSSEKKCFVAPFSLQLVRFQRSYHWVVDVFFLNCWESHEYPLENCLYFYALEVTKEITKRESDTIEALRLSSDKTK